MEKAAKAAFDCGVLSMLFVAGRSRALSDEAYRCFNDVKREYEEKGMLVGLMTPGMHAARNSLPFCSFFDVSDSSGTEGAGPEIDGRLLTSANA